MSKAPRGSRKSKQGLQRLLFADPESPDSQIGFTTRLLVAALPHSQPADNEFTRSSGFLDLCLLAPRRVGLPYGRYPRLACVWLITEAVRRRSPMLYLPRTFTQFAYQLGITPSSGQKGTLVLLREQLHRLVNVSISCLETRSSDASFGLTPRFFAGEAFAPSASTCSGGMIRLHRPKRDPTFSWTPTSFRRSSHTPYPSTSGSSSRSAPRWRWTSTCG